MWKKCYLCECRFQTDDPTESLCPDCDKHNSNYGVLDDVRPVRRCVMDETRYCVNCGVCKEVDK